jgi:hypothetical protein
MGMVRCLPRLNGSKGTAQLWALGACRLCVAETTGCYRSLVRRLTSSPSLRTGTTAHKIQGRLKPRKLTLDCNKFAKRSDVNSRGARRDHTAYHSDGILHVPPVEPRYASTRRVERARAMRYEVMGRVLVTTCLFCQGACGRWETVVDVMASHAR